MEKIAEQALNGVNEKTALLRSMELTENCLNQQEQKMLDKYAPRERDAVLCFVTWSRNRKFTGGIMTKVAAKQAFIEAFKMAQALYVPSEG